jgi:hypothetical protein
VINLNNVPGWLLGVGVCVAGIAAVFVFVFPGNGIRWGDAYYGPATPGIALLSQFGSELSEVNRDQRGVCLKFKNNSFTYCFDPDFGNFVSYNARNTAWRGLGKSPEDKDNR